MEIIKPLCISGDPWSETSLRYEICCQFGCKDYPLISYYWDNIPVRFLLGPDWKINIPRKTLSIIEFDLYHIKEDFLENTIGTACLFGYVSDFQPEIRGMVGVPISAWSCKEHEEKLRLVAWPGFFLGGSHGSSRGRGVSAQFVL